MAPGFLVLGRWFHVRGPRCSGVLRTSSGQARETARRPGESPLLPVFSALLSPFDDIVLLTAPADAMAARACARKRPEELALALHYRRAVEPAMRRSATIEIDTTAPLDDDVARIGSLLPARDDCWPRAVL
ncbi:MAG TPA: hypothetical protein VNM91_00860 [Dehalococcoidia bacterium]|nr:hypothetical protein [Dehalococcoidia bacterium]